MLWFLLDIEGSIEASIKPATLSIPIINFANEHREQGEATKPRY
jgi:hypothetical protein